MRKSKPIVCVVGLGYVGLPLAIAFGKKFLTYGYDISDYRIDNLEKKIDITGTFKDSDFNKAKYLNFEKNPTCISKSNFVIVCLPTPVNRFNKPDLSILLNGTKLVGHHLNKNTIIIFESTVYPTTTESICVPLLEKYSRLSYKKDFYVGYSPERINPGDKKHVLENIIKVVSGDTKNTLKKIKTLYQNIITAGVFSAVDIKTAETAKIIENTQRDLNISLMNELSIICHKLNIRTKDVLSAAKTKWNFLNFKPGLVGGHCIGVDPYYLSYLSKKIGHRPLVINAGRKVNDSMSKYIINKILFYLNKKKIKLKKSNFIFLGIAFKKNCGDIRNSKILEVINFFKSKVASIEIVDPRIEKNDIYQHKLKVKNWNNLKYKCNILIISSYHDEFKNIKPNTMKKNILTNGIVFDIMSELDDNYIKKMGREVWQL
jgi:UDP-N-acetyl-D-galactosamine dehydrogenase